MKKRTDVRFFIDGNPKGAPGSHPGETGCRLRIGCASAAPQLRTLSSPSFLMSAPSRTLTSLANWVYCSELM